MIMEESWFIIGTNMKSVAFNLNKESILLQLDQNDLFLDMSFEFPLQLRHNE